MLPLRSTPRLAVLLAALMALASSTSAQARQWPVILAPGVCRFVILAPGVQKLLERASQETPAAALQTLRRAEAVAAKCPDRGVRVDSLLAVSDLATRRGSDAIDKEKDAENAWLFCRHGLTLRERLTPNSLMTAHVLLALGRIARARHDVAASDAFQWRVLALSGRNAPLTKYSVRAWLNLIESAKGRGDRQAADARYERLFEIARGPLPPTAHSVNGLVDLYWALADGGRWSIRARPGELREVVERALSLERELPAGQRDQVVDALYTALATLGSDALSRGDPVAAARFSRGAVRVAEEMGRPEDISSALCYLAFALRAWTRDLPEAKALLERALQIREKHNSPWILTPLNELAAIMVEEGDLAGARVLLRRAVETAEQTNADNRKALGILGDLSYKEGDLAVARDFYLRYEQAVGGLVPYTLEALGRVEDELGNRKEAIARFRQALKLRDDQTPGSLYARTSLTRLERLLLEEGELEGSAALRRRREVVEEQLRAIPDAAELKRGLQPPASYPVVRFIAPGELDRVAGTTVEIHVAFLAPIPLARYRLWVNGRPLGEKGFEIPALDEKGQVLDRGRLLEKGDRLGEDHLFEKGRLLEKGEDREALARELPAEVAALVKQPQYAHFVQLRHTVPLEDVYGQFLRLSVQVETTGGSVSDRQILRLRRPEAEERRGSLRVLTVGIGEYRDLPKLKYAPADAVALAGALRAQSGLPDDHRLYRGSTIVSLTDVDATLARIRGELERLSAETRPGDTVVVALSGHGITKGTDTYFAPVRFDPENPTGTGLPWAEVLARLEGLRKTARSVWLLADCCRAAPGLRRLPSPPGGGAGGGVVAATASELKRSVEEGGNLIVVTASSGNEPSYESDDLKHGLFTQAWLEALRGEAPDLVYDQAPRGKVLTLSRLQFWLDASVIRHARAAGVRQAVEFPRLEASFSGSTPLFVPVPER